MFGRLALMPEGWCASRRKIVRSDDERGAENEGVASDIELEGGAVDHGVGPYDYVRPKGYRLLGCASIAAGFFGG